MDTIKAAFDKIVSSVDLKSTKVELLISGNERTKLGYQQKKLDKFEATQSELAGFRVIRDNNAGYSYTENLSFQGLQEAFKDALENSMVIHKPLNFDLQMPGPSQSPELQGLYFEEDVPMAEKLKMAEQLETMALEANSKVVNVPYSGFVDEKSWTRLLNSNGVDKQFTQSYYYGYSYPLAQKDEKSKCDGEAFFVRKFREADPKKIVTEAVDKVLQQLEAEPLKTGRYPVVISREIMGTFLQMLQGYFSAKALEKGSSLLAGKTGKRIASEIFNLSDDPFESRGLGIRPFDSEGSPSQITRLFESGVFKGFLTNLEYSQKLNLPHTSSAARSPSSPMDIAASTLVVGLGSSSLEGLVQTMGDGVYLTKIDGGLHAGFKEATGDFSLPAQGFWISNGKIASPIDQFVVSGNIIELLSKITALGSEYNKSGASYLAPDVMIQELSFAGK